MTNRQLTWFSRRVNLRSPEECWPWEGNLDQYGYGKFGNRGAHRVCYEHFLGDVPEGLQLDHLCRNRRCVNPAHMEPVTVGENIRRGHAARGTLGGRYGERKRAAQRRYYQRKKEALHSVHADLYDQREGK